VPDCRFSPHAIADLADISDYTAEQFGVNQSLAYQEKLRVCFRNLVQHPLLGKSAAEILPGIRRLECQSHVIFYKVDADGVRISRVLHASMDLQKHHIPE